MSTRNKIGLFSAVGYGIDAVGQAAKAASDVAFLTSSFTEALVPAGEMSADLLQQTLAVSIAETKAELDAVQKTIPAK